MDPQVMAALESQIGQIRRLMRAVARDAARYASPDLDAAGYAFLIAIRDLTVNGEPARIGDVADLMNLHKSSASRGVTALENLEFAERLPDPEDARARLVRLTQNGADAVVRAAEHWHIALVARTENWSTEELDQFARLLKRFTAN